MSFPQQHAPEGRDGDLTLEEKTAEPAHFSSWGACPAFEVVSATLTYLNKRKNLLCLRNNGTNSILMGNLPKKLANLSCIFAGEAPFTEVTFLFI